MTTMHHQTNRTGIARDPEGAEDMIEAARAGAEGLDPGDFVAYRLEEQRGKPPVATMPPSLRPDGRTPALLIDKLGERLAFERAGVRLYQTLVLKHEASGGFAGGPSREDLEEIRDDERRHLELLERAIVERGGDPTAVTPCANLVAVESRGLAAVVLDARTSLAEALHAIHVAELADNAGWEQLVELMEHIGDRDALDDFEDALEDEQDHLVRVRGWLAADAKGRLAEASAND